MSKAGSHKLEFGSPFIFADHLLSQTCRFMLKTSQPALVLKQIFHCQVPEKKWKRPNGGVCVCVVSINTENSSSLSLVTSDKKGKAKDFSQQFVLVLPFF